MKEGHKLAKQKVVWLSAINLLYDYAKRGKNETSRYNFISGTQERERGTDD